MDSLNFNSVESIPGIEARAAFTVNSSAVFKEDVDIMENTEHTAPSPRISTDPRKRNKIDPLARNKINPCRKDLSGRGFVFNFALRLVWRIKLKQFKS